VLFKIGFGKYSAPFKGFILNPFGPFDTKVGGNSKHVITKEEKKTCWSIIGPTFVAKNTEY
jgi:hypothetical protein